MKIGVYPRKLGGVTVTAFVILEHFSCTRWSGGCAFSALTYRVCEVALKLVSIFHFFSHVSQHFRLILPRAWRIWPNDLMCCSLIWDGHGSVLSKTYCLIIEVVIRRPWSLFPYFNLYINHCKFC